MVILIMEDWHSERTNAFRAFTADHSESISSCPMVGYASHYPHFSTIRACAEHARKMDKTAPIFRAFRDSRKSRLVKV